MGPNEQPASDRPQGETTPELSDVPAWQRSGEHRFHSRDDILFWECHGSMEVRDVQTMFEQRIALQIQQGRVFLLLDAHELDGIPAESRKYAIGFKPEPALVGAVVVFRASLLARTAVSFITTAAKLLGRLEQGVIFFAEDEAEARALVKRQRLALSLGLSRK